MSKILKKRKSKHPLHRFFFEKFQQQVSQAPGFKPLLSQEDFNRMFEAQLRAQLPEVPPESIIPPIEIVE